MAFKIITSILCDKCRTESLPIVAKKVSVRLTRKAAAEDGWKLGKQKDFWPSCRKDIEAAIKEASLGNL